MSLSALLVDRLCSSVSCRWTAENVDHILSVGDTMYLKGYSSGQSHFSEINAKLAEENEFVTHFAQKCLETREIEQNVVLNESSEALGNRKEIVWILALAMTTADDGVGGSNSV